MTKATTIPLQMILLFLVLAATCGRLLAQPLAGSQLSLEENKCAQCHGESILWEEDRRRLYLPLDELAEDIHWQKGVTCHDCHGGDPQSEKFARTHRKDQGFLATADEIKQSCVRCHRDTVIDVTRRGVHAKAGEKNELGAGTPIECSDCHGTVQHQLLASQDPRSPVFHDNQVKTCGACHEDELETHLTSVHGPDQFKGGSIPTASCADCHGTHGIFREPDRRSMLHTSNVATTCGTCHEGIESILQASVHKWERKPDEQTVGEPPHQKRIYQPTCTSCHQRHEPGPKRSDSPEFLFEQRLPHGCGNCHAKHASRHDQRLHSELTKVGYLPAAECSECHGGHDMLPLSDPNSRLGPAKRQTTCQECHPGTTENFSNFDPHAYYKDAEKYPLLHSVYVVMESVIFALLIFFGFHTVLWLLRSLVHVLWFGRHKRLASDQRAIIRFSKLHRAFHFTVILSLMGLAVTGLHLKYSDHTWAQKVADALGGFQLTSLLHRAFAVLMICYSVAYVVWISRVIAKSWKERWRIVLFGPDSPLPNLRDARELFGMLRWFFGMGVKPIFERWTYWEKFDYWAVVAIVIFIGTSGLIIWIPNLFAWFLPGGALNMAEMIHSKISLIGTSFLLAIHYFNTHFRPEKFPMDISVLTGLVSEEHLQRARPEFLERMRQQGKLDRLRATLPSRGRYRAIVFGGAVTHIVLLALLFGILWASLGG